MELKLVGLVKRFSESGNAAVDNVNLTVAPGKLVALLGPSGCGKTTTLRMIAGLAQPTEGDILFDGKSVLQQPPDKRNIGMVFQRYVLFPHMTVARNVGFGLFVRGKPRDETDRRVQEMLEVVQLSPLAKRFPSQLSGGQQQRVAIARTLVTDPQLLLMDEPLSNLDAKLREEMRSFIKQLQRRLGVTTVFVTHDQVEAMELADEIGVMFAGKLVQFGPPEEVFNRPSTPRVADFMGATNLIEGTVVASDREEAVLDTPAGRLRVRHPSPHVAGAKVQATIRPEHVDIAPSTAATEASQEPNSVKAVVEQAVYFGGHLSYQLRAGSSALKALDRSTRRFAEGEEVIVNLSPESIWIYPEARA